MSRGNETIGLNMQASTYNLPYSDHVREPLRSEAEKLNEESASPVFTPRRSLEVILEEALAGAEQRRDADLVRYYSCLIMQMSIEL
jgi:hypothetical protein